jgi:hypothetical protein
MITEEGLESGPAGAEHPGRARVASVLATVAMCALSRGPTNVLAGVPKTSWSDRRTLPAAGEAD